MVVSSVVIVLFGRTLQFLFTMIGLQVWVIWESNRSPRIKMRIKIGTTLLHMSELTPLLLIVRNYRLDLSSYLISGRIIVRS